MPEIRQIAVFGAGTMGHGIAQCAASRGYAVTLTDMEAKMLDRGRTLIDGSLKFMVESGRMTEAEAAETKARITFEPDNQRVAGSADLIFEAVFEDLDVKRNLFQALGEWTGPEVILASNTSSFDIARLAEVTRHPERVIGTHWFHPAQITPALEVIPTDQTRPELVQVVLELAGRLGKYATRCANRPGFVANRIQFAMIAEALAMVEEGVASPEEVDRIVKSSFGFRLGCFGPCEIADQAGLDVYRSIFASLYEALGREQFKPPKILDRMVEENRLGLKNGQGFYDYGQGAAEALLDRRDRMLMARLQLFEKENF